MCKRRRQSSGNVAAPVAIRNLFVPVEGFKVMLLEQTKIVAASL